MLLYINIRQNSMRGKDTELLMYHPHWRGLFTQAAVGLLLPTLLSGTAATFLNGMTWKLLTIHQEKFRGLCRSAPEGRGVNGVRFRSVKSLVVSALSCFKGESE